MTEPTLLLWSDSADVYVAALAAAGLDRAFAVETLASKSLPDAELLKRCTAMLAWRAPAGLLRRMPRLRWLQAATAGVEEWLARDDLPSQLVLTCARGIHRISMPENILAAL